MENIKPSSKFLHNLQGIILLVYHNSKHRASINEICKLPKEAYNDLVNQLENIDPKILQQYIRNLANLPKDKQKEGIISSLKRLEYNDNEIKEYLSKEEGEVKLPSIFQNDDTYRIMDELISRLKPAIKSLEYKIENWPIFATSQTFNFNAMAISPPEEERPLVLFEDETFLYCHLISKVLANSFGTEPGYLSIDEIPVKKHLDEHPEVADKFGEILFYSISRKSIVNVKQFSLISKERLPIVRYFCDSMEFYLLGHEMGHIIDGHLEIKKQKATPALENNAINPSWKMEFKADQIGLEISLETQKTTNQYYNYHLAGSDALMTFLHLQDVLKEKLKGNSDILYSKKSTHPPPMLRRKAMRDDYLYATQNQPGWNMANNTSHILFELWDRVKNKVIETYKAK